MLGLCTRHCTILILAAIAITVLTRWVPAPLHLPLAEPKGCVETWFGFPLGYWPSAQDCLSRWSYFFNYFANGLLNVLLFFFPLRWLHDRFWHRNEG